MRALVLMLILEASAPALAQTRVDTRIGGRISKGVTREAASDPASQKRVSDVSQACVDDRTAAAAPRNAIDLSLRPWAPEKLRPPFKDAPACRRGSEAQPGGQRAAQ